MEIILVVVLMAISRMDRGTWYRAGGEELRSKLLESVDGTHCDRKAITKPFSR